MALAATHCAERDERAASDFAAHRRRRLGNPAARHLEHRLGSLGEPARAGRQVEGSTRGQEHVAVEALPRQ